MIKEIDFSSPIVLYIDNENTILEPYIVLENNTQDFNSFKSILINDLEL